MKVFLFFGKKLTEMLLYDLYWCPNILWNLGKVFQLAKGNLSVSAHSSFELLLSLILHSKARNGQGFNIPFLPSDVQESTGLIKYSDFMDGKQILSVTDKYKYLKIKWSSVKVWRCDRLM